MRHANTTKKLGRTAAHRKATLQSLSMALLRHKRITTTLPKAKALRSFVEPIINRAKEDTTHNRRQAFRHLQDKEAVKVLFGEVADTLGDRPGGYTRVVKLGLRPGDAAEMAIIELVDFNDVKPEGTAGGRKKTRRGGGQGRRRAGGAAKTAQPAAKAAAKTSAAPADDLTKLWGIGPAIATALNEAGITTYAQLAEAALDAVREAVNTGTGTSDANVNEETWVAQARLAAAGDWDGLDALVEKLKAEGATAHDASEADAASAEEETTGPAPEEQAAEAVASDAANPEATGNPQVPLSPGVGEHGDAEQGAAPGTGEPPPESDAENRGRSQHRG